ncbi:hypothetical protein THF1D04_220024 [Vibrio owensii]|uniref:Uncharacterized protein n=1 Tax=Vibrio owensii TaxID=696485 RepID=A0AAU9Q5W5_9VIBR|nr:hypothetical protein THF1D04_220024 [Vibrio owensii]
MTKEINPLVFPQWKNETSVAAAVWRGFTPLLGDKPEPLPHVGHTIRENKPRLLKSLAVTALKITTSLLF